MVEVVGLARSATQNDRPALAWDMPVESLGRNRYRIPSDPGFLGAPSHWHVPVILVFVPFPGGGP